MARKRRAGAAQRSAPTDAIPAAPPASHGGSAPAREPTTGGGAAALLALTIFLAPALGVPGELMLQDTLKSIVVAFGALLAAGAFLWAQRGRREPLRWHAVLWLPLLLTAYALGSMAWSHRYLAGVEAIRWFLFAVIAWVGLNAFSRERLPWLAAGAWGGAIVASTWTVLQFWVDLQLFPQGPNPASTFVNRNFFAEFAVCTLPLGLLLLARARRSGAVTLLSLALGFVLTAILMTGTRSALVATWLELLVVLPLTAWRCRGQFAWSHWRPGLRLLAAGVTLGTVLVLGAIPSGNPKILEEGHGATALARSFVRTRSIGPDDYSLGIREIMWRATVRMIEDRPLSGVGAGAWENDIPLYQAEGAQLETDYYAHNEFLQLVAEYGLAGWAFLLLLVAYLATAAWRSWRATGAEAEAERPWRASFLASLLALMVVSNIGFPWRLASTGALFALSLGVLAASDARLAVAPRWLARPLRWSPPIAQGGLAATAACLVLALVISQKAAEAERDLVGAAKTALSITASGDWNNPRYAPLKREMLQQVRAGIAINPHYRKITPMVADELARWGDWADATWIWESVLRSRPSIVAIITNAARGYSSLGQDGKAFALLERAKKIQPDAAAVRSLEVILLARHGQEQRALALAKKAAADGVVDYDLVNSLAVLAWRAHDYPLAIQSLERRMQQWPESRARGELQLGTIYANDLHDPDKALAAFRAMAAAARPDERAALLEQVPPEFRARLEAAPRAPQTSASRP